MEYNGMISRPSMPRLGGALWTSSLEKYHCVLKVVEMLSGAIRHQEDLLELLVMSESQMENPNPNKSATSERTPTSSRTDSAISPPIMRAPTAKIENSMDWCHFALCSLRDVELRSTSKASSPGNFAQDGLLSTSFPKAGDGAGKKKPRRRLNTVPTPVSPCTGQGLSNDQLNMGNLLFTDPVPYLSSSRLPAGEDSSSLQQRWRRHQRQGHNFARFLASLHMDTVDWSLFQDETGPISAGLPAYLPSSAVDPAIDEVTDHLRYKFHAAFREDQSYKNMTTPTPLRRGNRTRYISGKSEDRKWNGGKAELEKVFQTLNDAKKGIPDDGHRGWKKYGNKTIQNSNHCRGYYKCNVKECRAKKTVQPTDKDPTLFEVTYVGKHSCNSSTRQRRRSSRSTSAACTPAPAVEVPVVQRKNKSAEIMEREGNSVHLFETNWVTEGGSIPENGWTGIIPGKMARAMAEDEKASHDNFTYLHTMTTSTTTTTTTTTSASEEPVVDASIDTYLHESLSPPQAVYSFQEPLFWHDFDIDTSLSTGHKSVSVESD